MPRHCARSIFLCAAALTPFANARADLAQWDFDGSLDATTGQAPLVEGVW